MAEPTLRQVRLFLALARCGSFRAAAERCAASPSSLSVQIQALEARIGAPLFERTTRTVRLSAVGAQLLADFERLANAADELTSRCAQLAAGQTGRLRIAVLPSIADEILPEVIARFRAHWPGVSIAIHEAIEDELTAAVESGQCDLGLTSARMLVHGLCFESLYRDELVAVLPLAHPLAAKARLSLRDLADQALVLTRRSTSLRQAIERAFADLEITVTPSYEVAYLATALSFAARGLGVALLPASSVRSVQRPDVIVRSLAGRAGARTMGVLQLHSAVGQALPSRFVALLREVVAELVPRRFWVGPRQALLAALPC